MAEGEPAVRELGRSLRKWRVGWLWYVVAFGLPVAEALLAVGAASAFGVFKLTRINITMVFYDGVDPRWMPWLKCGITALVTVALVLAAGRELVRQRARRPDAAPA